MTASTVQDEEGILCRSYTSARKSEKVTGVIQGKAMPWTSTNTQMVSFIATALIMVATRRWWGQPFPFLFQIPILAGASAAAWWYSRRFHPDHRSPARALTSAVNFYGRSRLGRHQGRRVAAFKPRVVGGGALYFCGGSK